jgi:hypothetical protein
MPVQSEDFSAFDEVIEKAKKSPTKASAMPQEDFSAFDEVIKKKVASTDLTQPTDGLKGGVSMSESGIFPSAIQQVKQKQAQSLPGPIVEGKKPMPKREGEPLLFNGEEYGIIRNYENAWLDFAKRDKSHTKIVDENTTTDFNPEKEIFGIGSRILKAVGNIIPGVEQPKEQDKKLSYSWSEGAIKNSEQDLSRYKQRADASLASLKPQLEKISKYAKDNYDQFTDTSISTGLPITDVNKIDKYSRELAKKIGVNETGNFKTLVYNEIKAAVSHKLIEPEVIKKFKELYQKETGRSYDADLTPTKEKLKIGGEKYEIEKGFEKGKEILSGLNQQANTIKLEVQNKQKQDVDILNQELKGEVDKLSQQFKIADEAFKQKYQGLIVDNKFIGDQQQYNQYLIDSDNLKKQSTQLGATAEKLSNDFISKQHLIANKANARYRRQIDEISRLAYDKYNKELQKYYSVFRANPQLAERSERLYKQAYSDVLNKNEELKEIISNTNTSPAVNFFRSTLASLGGSIKGISTSMGFDAGSVFGDYLEKNFEVGSPELKSLSDILDFQKLARSGGQLAGSMLPTMAIELPAMALTRGIGGGVLSQMLVGGVIQNTIETADIAGRMKADVFAKTGDPDAAQKAAEESMKSQYYAIPFNVISTLPFIGGSTKMIKNVVGRVLASGAVEFSSELPVEYWQNLAEESIKETGTYKNALKFHTNEKLGNTALNIAPVFLMGAAGELMPEGKSADQKMIEREAKSFALKTKFADLAPSQKNQFVFDLVQRKGNAFASTFLTSLYTTGNINKATLDELGKTLQESNSLISKSKELGLTPADQKIFMAFQMQYNATQKALEGEQDPILKKALETKLKSYETEINNFTTNKKGNYVVLTYPNNEQYVLTYSEAENALNNDGFVNALGKGDIKLDAFGDNEAFNQKVEQTKKDYESKTKLIEQGEAVTPTGAEAIPTVTGEAEGQKVEGAVPTDGEPVGEGTTEAAPAVLKDVESTAKALEDRQWLWDKERVSGQNPSEWYFFNPTIGNRPFMGKRFERTSTEMVDINDIVPTQREISASKSRNIKEVTNEQPKLIKVGEKYYVFDGHHRIANDILNKKTKIDAEVFNYDKAKKDGSNPELVKAVEELLGKPTEAKAAPAVLEGEPETAVGQDVVIQQMKPFTDEMVKIEREFENNNYEISTDYDNEIIVTDKDGEIIGPEDLPPNLLKLAQDYEKAVGKLGEFDASAMERALAESRKIEEGQAEVVETEQAKLSPVLGKEEAPKLNAKSETFTTKSGKQTIKKVGDKLIVADAKTGKEVSKGTERKALKEWEENFDFLAGEKATEPNFEGSYRDYSEHAIETSQNPLEVAEIYIGEKEAPESLNTREMLIAEYGGLQTTSKSFAENADKNIITLSMAKTYFNKKSGRPIDVIAHEISEHYGVEVTPEDVTNFMIRFPNGKVKAKESVVAIKASNKFKELTGLNLTEALANRIIDKEFKKLKTKQQELLNKEYESAQQLEDDYWKAFAETDGFTKESTTSKIEPTIEAKPAEAAKVEPTEKVEEAPAGKPKVAPPSKAAEKLKKAKERKEAAVAPGMPKEGINVSNKSDLVDLLDRVQEESKKRILQAAQKGINTLKSIFPDMDIYVHEDADSYNKAMIEFKGRKNSRGNFSFWEDEDGKTKGRIDINLSNAVETTVAHEITHAILLKQFGENPAAYKQFRDRISKVIREDLDKKLVEFENRYAGLEVAPEEYLTQLTAILATKAESVTYKPTTLRKIAAIINELVTRITNGKFSPFKSEADFKNFVDFLNQVSGAIREGAEINLQEKEQGDSVVSGVVSLEKIKNKSDLGFKKFDIGWEISSESGIVLNVPQNKKTLYDIVEKSGGAIVVINSDATGIGVTKDKDLLQGGIGYTFIAENVNDNIGFAASNDGKISSFYEAVLDAANKRDAEFPEMKGKPVAVFVMVQTPAAMFGNAYSADYFGRVLNKITTSKLFNTTEAKKEIIEFIEDYKANNKTGKKYANSLDKLSDLIRTTDFSKKESLKKIVDLLITNRASKEDKSAKFGFDIRRSFFEKFFVGVGTVKEGAPARNLRLKLKEKGYNHDGFFKEFGDKNVMSLLEGDTPGRKLSDGNFTLTGFFVDPNISKEDYVQNSKKGTYQHKQFNSKFYGINPFVLDGKYYVDKVFPEARFVSKKTGEEVPVQVAAAGSLYPRTQKSAQQIIERAKNIKSKAQLVHDETGFISVPSMIEIVKSNNPDYLGGVMQHIEEMGEKLKSGKVNARDVAKSYLMAVSSIRSGDIGIEKFESAINKKVDEVFLEPNNKIRTEGAMAFLLTTDEGKRFLKNVESGKIDEIDRQFISKSMKPFGMFGVGESKFSNIFGGTEKNQINLTNITEFNSLLKKGIKNESELFDAIVKLKGISQAKVGFVSNFLGIGTRGVIDAREIQGWLRGAVFQGERTAKEAEIEKELTKSNKSLSPLQKEILSRMRAVGEAFGINPLLAEYIGHHMIWDAVAKEKTTHNGLYLAMSQNNNEFYKNLNKIKSRQDIEAFQGSPYEFEEFLMSKIGTGEGSQRFGWGLYFSDLKEIAEYYADVLTKKLGKKGKGKIYKATLHEGKTPDQYTYLEWTERTKKEIRNRILEQFIQENDISRKDLNKLIEEGIQYLDASEAGELFKETGIPFKKGMVIKTLLDDEYPASGNLIYDALQRYFDNNPQKASEFLLRAKIDGIKYPAESIARGATSATARGYNYVVFDENAITIKSRQDIGEDYSEMKDIVQDYLDEGISLEDTIESITDELGDSSQGTKDLITKAYNELKGGKKPEEKAAEPEEAPKPKIENKEAKTEFDKLTSDIPKSGEVRTYLSGETIEKYEGEKARNEQEVLAQQLRPALERGIDIIKKAKELFGDNFVAGLLNYLETENLPPANKALIYVSLENELAKQKIENPSNAPSIEKLQDLVRAASQAYLRSNSLAINFGRLRKFAEVGYDVSKMTDNFFSTQQLEDKKKIEEAIQATSTDINKAAEEKIKEEEEIKRKIDEGVESEIAKLFEQFSETKKKVINKTVSALNKAMAKLSSKSYKSGFKSRSDLDEAMSRGYKKMERALKAGISPADAIEIGIKEIKSIYEKEYGTTWTEEAEFRKDVTDALVSEGAMESKKEGSEIKRLEKEILDLNRQIEKGQKDKFEKKKTKESEALDRLREEKAEKQAILEALDPTPRMFIENALIEQGFGREINVKTKEGIEKRMVLDWKKLAGAEGSVDNIRKRVEAALRDKGYSEEQILRMQDAFVEEYNNLAASIAEKALNEINARNKKAVTPEQKSAVRKLVEMYNYGLFDKDPSEYEVALAKTLGFTGMSVESLKKVSELGEAMSNLFNSNFEGQPLNESQLRTAIQVIEEQMRVILNMEALREGGNLFKLTELTRMYMDASQRMMLNTFKQGLENPISGLLERFYSSIAYAGKIPETLNAQQRKLARDIYKEMVLQKGLGYGNVGNAFITTGNIDAYVNKLPDSALVQGIMSVAMGKTILDAVDSSYKAKITQQKFTYNLIKILTKDRIVNGKEVKGMSVDEAKKYVAEKISGQSFEKAKETAKNIIDNVNRSAGRKIFNDSPQFVNRLATDIVNAALINGEAITEEMVTAAYNAAYRAAGRGLGHVSNNVVTTAVNTATGKIETDRKKAIAEKKYKDAIYLNLFSVLYRNIINPFVGGGTNWIVLKAEKTGLGLISGLISMARNNTKINMTTETGMKELEDALYKQMKDKDKLTRGAIGGLITALTFMLIKGTAADDEYEKWIKKNPWARKYINIFTPEIALLMIAANASEKDYIKYLEGTLNMGDQFDKGKMALKVLYSKDHSIPLGTLLGSSIGNPIPWRLVRDGQQLWAGATGGEPYVVSPVKPTNFAEAYLKGGMFDFFKTMMSDQPKEKKIGEKFPESEGIKWLEKNNVDFPKLPDLTKIEVNTNDKHPEGKMTAEEQSKFKEIWEKEAVKNIDEIYKKVEKTGFSIDKEKFKEIKSRAAEQATKETHDKMRKYYKRDELYNKEEKTFRRRILGINPK